MLNVQMTGMLLDYKAGLLIIGIVFVNAIPTQQPLVQHVETPWYFTTVLIFIVMCLLPSAIHACRFGMQSFHTKIS